MTALIPDAFWEQARRTPSSTALVCGGRTATFAELAAESDRLARELLDRGVGADTLVAVMVERSVDLIVSLLAVLKAGAGFVPVDTGYPAERIAAILADARPACLIADAVPDGAAGDVMQPGYGAGAARSPVDVTDQGRLRPLDPRDVAYVLFTSGSTGRPKSVVVEHRSLANLLASHRDLLFGPAMSLVGRQRLRAAHTAAVSFDAAWDPVLWMVDGHELHLVDDLTRRDPYALKDYLIRERIDVIETTPTFFDQLWATGLFEGPPEQRPRVVALGGEAVTEARWQALRRLPDSLVLNLYGPTECTVDSVLAAVSDHPSPVIGRPVENIRAYVLDEDRRPSAVGELHLGGDGVARGYLRRPGLTAERFVPDPFAGDGSRMYRTGDLVRRRSSGALEYLGRLDHQVKVNGHRIELGEIESVLLKHPDVGRAAAVVHRDRARGRRIVGYVVATSGANPDPAELRAHAAAYLASYMVPAAVVIVPTIPLTPNGKLDRAALPDPGSVGAPPTQGASRPPEDATERLLARLFAEVLAVSSVGSHDDFFTIGGDSVAAIRFLGLARDAGLIFSLREVFEHRRPSALAGLHATKPQTA